MGTTSPATADQSNVAAAVYNTCDDLWFYGSELLAYADRPNTGLQGVTMFGGQLHFYGGSIRTMTAPGVDLNAEIIGIQAEDFRTVSPKFICTARAST